MYCLQLLFSGKQIDHDNLFFTIILFDFILEKMINYVIGGYLGLPEILAIIKFIANI